MIFKVKFPCCHTLGSSSSSASSFSFACSGKGRPTPTPTCRCFWGAAAATKGCKLINENAFIHASDDVGRLEPKQVRARVQIRIRNGARLAAYVTLLVLLSRTCVATTCCFIRQRNVSLTGIAFRSLPTGNFSCFCCLLTPLFMATRSKVSVRTP